MDSVLEGIFLFIGEVFLLVVDTLAINFMKFITGDTLEGQTIALLFVKGGFFISGILKRRY